MYDQKRTFDLGRQTETNISAKDKRINTYYTASPVDVFLTPVNKAPFSSRKSFRLTSDIYMLFNQQRLDRLTSQALLQHFESLAVKDSQFASLKSKLTDNQLISIVKSRYCQSPSELLSWSRYLNTLTEKQLQEYVQTVQQQQEQQQTRENDTSTTVNVTPE